jgi:hypothetical protein
MNKHEVRILVTQGVFGEVCLVFKTKKKKLAWTTKLEEIGFSYISYVDKFAHVCYLDKKS